MINIAALDIVHITVFYKCCTIFIPDFVFVQNQNLKTVEKVKKKRSNAILRQELCRPYKAPDIMNS